jgi:hypothetical protein
MVTRLIGGRCPRVIAFGCTVLSPNSEHRKRHVDGSARESPVTLAEDFSLLLTL